jgi:hypothetical protein
LELVIDRDAVAVRSAAFTQARLARMVELLPGWVEKFVTGM